MDPVTSLRIGNCLIENDLDRITCGAHTITLRPQVMDVLLYLAARQNEVIHSDELLDTLWPGKVVTSASVYNCITELRQAFKSLDPGTPYVDTVPKRGYRLVADVHSEPAIPGDTPPPPARPRGRLGKPLTLVVVSAVVALVLVFVLADLRDRQIAPPAGPERSIAVIPFDDLSPDPNRYWAAGITEDVMHALAQLPEMRIAGRATGEEIRRRQLSLAEVHDSLEFNYLVEGSLRVVGDEIRVTYRLIQTSDGTQLWSDSLDRTRQNALVLQQEIAEAIARALQVVIDDDERSVMLTLGTRDVDAYNHFLQGRALFYEWAMGGGAADTIWRADEWLEKALGADPGFAAAYTLRAYPYIHYLDGAISDFGLATGISKREADEIAVTRLRAYTAEAISHAQDPGIRLVNQFRLALYSDDFSALQQLARTADPADLAGVPGHIDADRVARILCLLGYPNKVRALAEQKIRLDPLSGHGYIQAWGAAMIGGDWQAANDYVEQGIAVAGPMIYFDHNLLMTRLAEKRMNEVLRMAEAPDWGVEEYRSSLLALVYAISGRGADARQIVSDLLLAKREDIFLALALQELGEVENALAMLASLDNSPGGSMHFIHTIVEFGGRVPFDLTHTPRFAARLAEINVKPERLYLRSRED